MKKEINNTVGSTDLNLGRIFGVQLYPPEGETHLKTSREFRLMVFHYLDGKETKTFLNPEQFSTVCSIMGMQARLYNFIWELPDFKLDSDYIKQHVDTSPLPKFENE